VRRLIPRSLMPETASRSASCTSEWGNFHRSHQAMYVDRLLRLGKAREWGSAASVSCLIDAEMRDALRSQDCEYTLRGAAPEWR